MQNKSTVAALLSSAGLVLAILAVAGNASATMVTSLADSGAGTLREAIANHSNGETITFDPTLYSGGSQSISLIPYCRLPPY